MKTITRLQLAEEAIQEAKKTMNSRYRLGYHIMPEANWMNDPNGLIQFNGEYHVFYQHHPYDENWGPMHWGHVKSKDLVNWEYCPIALAPGDACDKDGCFSGSAVNNNGELTLIYTGHNYIDKEADTFFQNQNIAVSTDGIHFEKYEQNPVIAEPPSDSQHHFRDPKVWKHNDFWYMIVGNSTEDNGGRVILFRSVDLRHWDYCGVLAENNGENGFMWECPDFFELDGKYILMFSPQGMEAKGDLYNNLFQTGYFIGEYEYETNTYTHNSFQELDNGHDFYAVQTFLDDQNRRIAVGWMDMWNSDMPTKQDGWCGALTLPRVLTLGDDQKVRMNPVPELIKLRQSEYKEYGFEITSQKLFQTTENQLELKVVFNLTNTEADRVGCKILGKGEEETIISFNPKEEKLVLDCTKSGKKEDGIRKVTMKAEEKLILHLYLDRSSIEVFANEGAATMTSRMYPTEDQLGFELFVENGKATVEEVCYWTLKDIWNQ